MSIHTLVPGIAAILCGIFLTLLAYNIIGRNFSHQDFHNWLEKRKTLYRFLGPVLVIAGVIILIFR